MEKRFGKDDDSDQSIESSSSCDQDPFHAAFSNHYKLDLKNMLASVQRFRNLGSNKDVKINQDSNRQANVRELKVQKVKIIEVDYLKDCPVQISKDIYDLTVGANFMGVLTPLEQSYCFGKCVLCFIIQMIIIWGFVSQSLQLSNFQPFLTRQVFLRFILSVLYQVVHHKEMQDVLIMLTFLKQ